MFKIALLASAALATASFAHASIHGGPNVLPPPGTCPYPTAETDGCLLAQASGAPLIANLQTYAALSGQTWTSAHPWGFNGPGVDYHVSYDPTVPFKHVAIDALPPGCVYQAVGTQNGGPELLCDKVGTVFPVNVVFDHWDFSDSGDVAHPGCVYVHFTKRSQNNLPSTRVFTNNKFQYNGKCIVNGGLLFSAELGSTFTFVFKYNEVDGAWPTSLPATGHVSSAAIWLAAGPSDVEFNYFHDIASRPMNGGVTSAPLVLAHNLISGFSLDPSGAHGAIVENLPVKGSFGTSTQYSYNVIVGSPQTPFAAITTAFSMLSQHTPTPWTGVSEDFAKIDHNIVVTNKNGGAYTFGVALTWVSYFRHIGAYTVQDNWVDPTGSLACAQNLGGAFALGGFVDDGSTPGTYSGVPGNTLTVKSLSNGSIYEGATFHALNAGAWADAVIQPYGSTCDGRASTGTNANIPPYPPSTGFVTFCLNGGPQKINMPYANHSTDPQGQTQNTQIDTTIFGDVGHENFNMRDGTTITISGIQWYNGGSSQCNGHA